MNCTSNTNDNASNNSQQNTSQLNVEISITSAVYITYIVVRNAGTQHGNKRAFSLHRTPRNTYNIKGHTTNKIFKIRVFRIIFLPSNLVD